jgi:hypothetical protein
MLEAGGQHDLAQEALGAQRGRQVRVEHLERDHPVVAEVPGQPDARHAASSKLALDDVAAAQPLGEILLALIHALAWERSRRAIWREGPRQAQVSGSRAKAIKTVPAGLEPRGHGLSPGGGR